MESNYHPKGELMTGSQLDSIVYDTPCYCFSDKSKFDIDKNVIYKSVDLFEVEEPFYSIKIDSFYDDFQKELFVHIGWFEVLFKDLQEIKILSIRLTGETSKSKLALVTKYKETFTKAWGDEKYDEVDYEYIGFSVFDPSLYTF